MKKKRSIGIIVLICAILIYLNIDDSKETDELIQSFESYHELDMDFDGRNEIVGILLNEEGFYETWFISSDHKSVEKIESVDTGMEIAELIVVAHPRERHIVLNAYRVMGTDKRHSIYRLNDEKITVLTSNRSGTVGVDMNGDIYYSIERYDGMYDPEIEGYLMHTEKRSYLYFEENDYKEYGATEITEIEFMEYLNGYSFLEQVKENLKKEASDVIEYKFYNRSNGIVHIQADIYHDSGEIEFGYYTFRENNGELIELLQYVPGIMLPYFSDYVVTY